MVTHVGEEVQEGVPTQSAHSQRHQEAEEELEEDSVHERDEDDAEQGQQTDDGDGQEPTDPRCNNKKQHMKTDLWVLLDISIQKIFLNIASIFRFSLFLAKILVFRPVQMSAKVHVEICT